LITLTGTGGVGKTRLAIEAARAASARFRGGAWLVSLAPIREPDQVPVAILDALGLPAAGARPATEALADHLRSSRHLLVLDNFEQALAAAPLVAEMVAAVPRLKVLVTTRAPLRLRAEHECCVQCSSTVLPIGGAQPVSSSLRPGVPLTVMSEPVPDGRRRTPRYLTVGWVLLLLLGLFPLVSVAADLIADFTTGIPGDHLGAFARLAGMTWASAQRTALGMTNYVTMLEIGYALHELVFAILFLFILVVPFRRGERWAWWASWALLIADLGYTFTFGRYDSTILLRSLVVDIALPVLLLVQVPRFFGRAARSGVDAAR
jgi:hypothetical protein